MQKGDKVKVIGPEKWLQKLGVDNRLGHIGIVALTEPAACLLIEGRGMTSIFRVSFPDAQEGMFHHIPGPCLEVME